MESSKEIYKNVGISIATLSLVALIYLTVYEAKQANNQVSAADATMPSIATTSADPLQSAAPTNAFPQPNTSSPISSLSAVTHSSITHTSTTAVSSNVYTDGTYSATGSYYSPGGLDFVSVRLTLKNDIITSVTAAPSAQDGTSREYQAMFVSGYKQYVVGKDIRSVHLDVVSGSSLTSEGFNAALAKIESEAKA